MLLLIGNIVGALGVLCFLLAYFFLQKDTWKAHSRVYLGTNLTGAILLMISLIIDWNLSAFLLEAAWAAISIWGLFKVRAGDPVQRRWRSRD